jgi:hypothetical protein
MKIRNIILNLPVLLISLPIMAEDSASVVDKQPSIPVVFEFPWELLVDRGKINGCIYENAFYSVGSILIEDSLPRKCHIDSSRDGFWAELDERDLEIFEASRPENAPKVEFDQESLDRLGKAVVYHIRNRNK